MHDDLRHSINRVIAGGREEADLLAITQALQTGNLTLSSCQGEVSVGQDAANSVVILGNENIIGDRNIVIYGVDAKAIQTVLSQYSSSEESVGDYQEQVSNLTSIPENLPRSGAVNFVGRNAVMAQLHQMLQQNHHVAVSAIAGMGGVGKTELALQYALKYKSFYPAGICWLSAVEVNVETQIVQFGRSLLNLNPPEHLELLDQVKFCWRYWQSGEVLLVFDDVTDYSAIKPYLPSSAASRFKILITTRLKLGASINQIELKVLDETAALVLLESLVGSNRIQAERDKAQQLCAQLGYLPLGLELVGRYLARKSDLSLAAMLQRLRDKRLAARALCQVDDDMTARLGVAAAFELSWDTLSENARSLGYVLSLFAAAPISWSLVEQCLPDQDIEELEEIRDNELLNLHLLQQTKTATYRLHPLIRDFLQTKSSVYKIANCSETLERILKLGKHLKQGGHWFFLKIICEKLLPFINEEKKASCLILLGETQIEFGDLEQAEKSCQNAFSIAQSQNDETNIELSQSLLGLIDNFRREDELHEKSLKLKTKYKKFYSHSSSPTGFDFPKFLAKCQRENAALNAYTQRKILKSQQEAYGAFIKEYGRSELANTTFLPKVGETLVKLGEAEINAGNLAVAGEVLQEALEVVKKCSMRKYVALANYHLARLERLLQNIDLAETHYLEACNIFQSLGATRDLKHIQREWQHMTDDLNS